MIDITLLGTNALLPIPERALSSAVLSCSGRSILFDCGEGTQTAARKAGVSLMKTDLIALTHFHGDHIFGLPGLLQTMNCLGRSAPLYITGPEGLEDIMNPIMQLVGETVYPVIPASIPAEGFSLNKISDVWPKEAKLLGFETIHRVSSCGYRFELNRPRRFLAERADELGIPGECRKRLQDGESVTFGEKTWTPEMVLDEPRRGLSFCFTGDTMYGDTVIDGCRDADLLICDATYAMNEQTELAHERGHMTFEEAGMLARVSGAKALILSHYSQRIGDPDEYIRNAKEVFYNTACGYDGMRIALRYVD